MKNFNDKLVGCREKKMIVREAGELYRAASEADCYRRVQRFKKRWSKYRNHKALQYFFKMFPDSVKYFELPESYWPIARTTNRLERLFEELKRRIKPFRRPSCRRWLFALLYEFNETNLGCIFCQSQQSS